MKVKIILLATTAMYGVLCHGALAQEAADLEEVVVTATRQTSTVNRVPLSVSAVTSQALQQQGVRDIQDLARNVPSLNFTRAGADGRPSVSIRGLGSALGSPTTGIYLDDVPIQKRDAAGAVTGNGSPFPQIFDLERVEVLRGPQGTLYGGSAQGGAIRFITPTPSLTTYSANARAEVSKVDTGGWGYEGGFGVGGPIVQDKLGFRASAWARHQGGYLDHYSLYTGQKFADNSNFKNAQVLQLNLRWMPTENFTVSPSIYYSNDKANNNDIYQLDIPQITYASGVFTNRGTTQSGVLYDFPDTTFTGGTFGPYDQFGLFRTFQGYYPTTTGTPELRTSPRRTELIVPRLTLDYDFGWMTAKSITAIVQDRTTGSTAGALGHRNQVLPNATNTQFVRAGSVAATCGNTSSVTDDGVCRSPVTGGIGGTVLFIPGFPQRQTQSDIFYQRVQLTQELRFQSGSSAERFTWVAGIFYSQARYRGQLLEEGNEEQSSIFLRGVGEEWFMGQTNASRLGQNLPVGVAGLHAFRDLHSVDREIAAFGEANYAITSKLKATAGIRLAKVDLDYLQLNAGSVQGNVDGFLGTPQPPTRITNPNQGQPFANQPGGPNFKIQEGSGTEKPISPKLGLSYQATERDLFYATMASGYRPGGVNQPVSVANCAPTLAIIGLDAIPRDYKSDKVVSYELGAKNRIFGWQVNSSLYYIDWKGPQISQRLTQCGFGYIDNAGRAVSKGFDIQAQGRVGPITLTGSVAYTNAKYTETVLTPVPPGTPAQTVVSEGDELGSPKWQFMLGAQYDFQLAGKYGAYIRADYQYSGKYYRTPGPPSFTYQALVYEGLPLNNVNARAGVRFNKFEASVFVNNLTNEDTVTSLSNTVPSVVTTATSPRPREMGLTLTYRY